jgi:hypothetical protein
MNSDRALYENQYIGAFIYALGLISGRRRQGGVEGFSLIQQTPADRGLADMFAKWRGRCLLWEFKRDRHEIKDEMGKPAKWKVLTELQKAENHMLRTIGDRCHFLACGKERRTQLGLTIDIEFFPYSVAFTQKETGALGWPMSLERFVGNIVSKDGNAPGEIGVDDEPFDDYVEFLQRCTEAPSGVNGVAVKIDARGRVLLARFDGLERLRHITKTMAGRSPERPGIDEPSLELRKPERRPSRERDLGR